MLEHIEYTILHENFKFLENFTIIGRESIKSMKGNL